jgi:hypothetical protein
LKIIPLEQWTYRYTIVAQRCLETFVSSAARRWEEGGAIDGVFPRITKLHPDAMRIDCAMQTGQWGPRDPELRSAPVRPSPLAVLAGAGPIGSSLGRSRCCAGAVRIAFGY